MNFDHECLFLIVLLLVYFHSCKAYGACSFSYNIGVCSGDSPKHYDYWGGGIFIFLFFHYRIPFFVHFEGLHVWTTYWKSPLNTHTHILNFVAWLCFGFLQVAAKKQTLKNVTDYITDIICKRSEKGYNYGIILIPEGLIDFIPEVWFWKTAIQLALFSWFFDCSALLIVFFYLFNHKMCRYSN